MFIENGLVSVITPVYNAEQYIEKCIQSILDQTYPHWELILVDDGSTDQSGTICDRFAREDSRIHVIHKPNGGVSSARNTGLDNARGDYITWLDSDDYLEPTMMEKVLAAMKAHDKQVGMCNYKNITVHNAESIRYKDITTDRVYSRETMVGFILSVGLTPVLWANIMARSLYEGIRFPEGRLFEDVCTTYKLHERANGAVMLAEPLLVRTQHLDSISRVRNLTNRVDGGLIYIDRYNDAVERWPQYKRSMLVSSARTLRILRNNVLHNPPWKFSTCKKDIQKICRFYRSHTRDILPSDANIFFRMEFFFLTSGTYLGFVCAMGAATLGLKPRSYLKLLKTPDLPPR